MCSNQSVHEELEEELGEFELECESETYETIDPEIRATSRIYDSLFNKALTLKQSDKQFIIEFVSGNQYNGLLSKNKLFGQGIYKWLDGVIYSGCFERNKMQNYGVIKYPYEISYCGDIKDGQWSGYGKLKFDKFLMKGHFRNGRAVGRASTHTSLHTFDGLMHNDKPKYGVRKYSNGTFEGLFDNFGYRFKGKFVFQNNDSYNGNWNSDMFCDFGIYLWGDNKTKSSSVVLRGSYTGYWLNGMRHGIGKMEFQDRVVCCMWEKDEKQGPGIVISANGAIYATTEMFFKNHFVYGMRVNRCREACDLIEEMFKLCECEYPEHEMEIIPCIIDNEYSFVNSLNYENCECQTLDDISNDIESRDYSWQSQTYNCSQNKLLSRSEVFKTKIKELIDLFAEINEKPFSNALFIPNYKVDNKILRPWLFQTIREHYFNYSINTIYEQELSFLLQMLEDNYDLCSDIYDMYTTLNKAVIRTCHSGMTRLGLWIFYENVFAGTKYNICELVMEADVCFGLTGNNEKHWDPFSKVYFWEFILHILYAVSVINSNPFIFNYSMKEVPKFYGRFAAMISTFLRQHQFLEPSIDKTLSNSFQATIIEKMFSRIKIDVYPIRIKNVFEFLKENFLMGSFDFMLLEAFRKTTEIGINEKAAYQSDFKLTPSQCLVLVLKFIEQLLLENTE